MNTSASPLGIATVALPAGSVTLHDRRTSRSWQVEVRPFHLGVTAVTRDQFRAVGADGPEHGGGDHPVESVSWWDAAGFCNALSARARLTPAYDLDPDRGEARLLEDGDGYRLPTEAEWEYACRAGTTGPRYGELDDIAWHRDNAFGRLHPVATRTPNAWGLYDMLGNVWEWCWDLYDAEVYGSYRVLRGGGWADPHWSVRASVRRRSHPTYRIDDVGFRVARSVAGTV